MALRSGYYGIKGKILSKLLPDYSTPGVKTNSELTASIQNIDQSKTVYGSGTYKDLDNVTTSGLYSVWGSALNKPSDIVQMQNATLIVTNNPIGTQITQTLINGTEHNIYTRFFANNVWGSWYKFTGTEVS